MPPPNHRHKSGQIEMIYKSILEIMKVKLRLTHQIVIPYQFWVQLTQLAEPEIQILLHCED